MRSSSSKPYRKSSVKAILMLVSFPLLNKEHSLKLLSEKTELMNVIDM